MTSVSRVFGLRGRLRWLLLVLFVFFRLGVVATAVELSMLDHVAGEIVEFVTGEASPNHAGECDERSCPPGCPSCHHHHGGFLPVPLSEASITHLVAPSETLCAHAKTADRRRADNCAADRSVLKAPPCCPRERNSLTSARALVSRDESKCPGLSLDGDACNVLHCKTRRTSGRSRKKTTWARSTARSPSIVGMPRRSGA